MTELSMLARLQAPAPTREASGPVIGWGKCSICKPSSASLVVNSDARISPVSASTRCEVFSMLSASGCHVSQVTTHRVCRGGDPCCPPAGEQVLRSSNMALARPGFRPTGSGASDRARPDRGRGAVGWNRSGPRSAGAPAGTLTLSGSLGPNSGPAHRVWCGALALARRRSLPPRTKR
jgi:hypothetical protein